METITWKYVKTLREENAVCDFLKANKINLPAALISILADYNGGRPNIKDFCTVNKQEHVFKSLLSYNEEDMETIYKVYPGIFTGSSLYPIGSDPAGNYICYDQLLKKYMFWNHETNFTEEIESLPFVE